MKKIFNNSFAIILAVVFIVLAALSAIVLDGIFSSPEHYADSISYLDEMKMKATGITAGTAAASAALAAIPGDVTTPIANQISSLGVYMVVVVAVIVLERFLVTILGHLAFAYIIPVACVLIAAFFIIGKRALLNIGVKLLIFAIIIANVIPISTQLGEMIYDIHRSDIEKNIVIEGETTESFEIVIEDTEESKQDKKEEKSEEKGGIFSKVKETAKETATHITNAVSETTTNVTSIVSNTAGNVVTKSKEILSHFIDAVAVLLITVCVIPVCVVIVVMWALKLVFGINIPTKSLPFVNNLNRKMKRTEEVAEAEVIELLSE